MDILTGRPDHIEDWLVNKKIGQWFGWGHKEKLYSNLLIHDGSPKPTEQECIDGMAQLQTAFDDARTKRETDKASGDSKLEELGLTDDEIKAITGR